MNKKHLDQVIKEIKASGADLNAVRLAFKAACDRLERKSRKGVAR